MQVPVRAAAAAALTVLADPGGLHRLPAGRGRPPCRNGLRALWRSSRPIPVVLTAGTALTGPATVDPVRSYAEVTAGAGFLARLATAQPLTGAP